MGLMGIRMGLGVRVGNWLLQSRMSDGERDEIME